MYQKCINFTINYMNQNNIINSSINMDISDEQYDNALDNETFKEIIKVLNCDEISNNQYNINDMDTKQENNEVSNNQYNINDMDTKQENNEVSNNQYNINDMDTNNINDMDTKQENNEVPNNQYNINDMDTNDVNNMNYNDTSINTNFIPQTSTEYQFEQINNDEYKNYITIIFSNKDVLKICKSKSSQELINMGYYEHFYNSNDRNIVYENDLNLNVHKLVQYLNSDKYEFELSDINILIFIDKYNMFSNKYIVVNIRKISDLIIYNKFIYADKFHVNIFIGKNDLFNNFYKIYNKIKSKSIKTTLLEMYISVVSKYTPSNEDPIIYYDNTWELDTRLFSKNKYVYIHDDKHRIEFELIKKNKSHTIFSTIPTDVPDIIINNFKIRDIDTGICINQTINGEKNEMYYNMINIVLKTYDI